MNVSGNNIKEATEAFIRLPCPEIKQDKTRTRRRKK